MKALVVAALSALIVTSAALSPADAKTARECEAEWQAKKAEFQAKGITEKAYVDECRKADSTAAATAPKAKKEPAPAATGAGEFATEAAAKAHCPTDVVVWVNLDSKIYHYAGASRYGKTKKGAYMCEKEAIAAKMRAAKKEKRPA